VQTNMAMMLTIVVAMQAEAASEFYGQPFAQPSGAGLRLSVSSTLATTMSTKPQF
jgi:hypothetical protein